MPANSQPARPVLEARPAARPSLFYLRFAAYASTYLLWILLIFYATGGYATGGRFTGGFHGTAFRGTTASWLAGWQQWDARWYEQIWLRGYAADPKTLVFPPGYPYLVGTFSKLLHKSFFATAVFLNLAAFFAAAVLIAEWFSRKFTVSAYLLFLFVLSAPAAYFAFTAYSDVVFMLLLWILLALSLPAKARDGKQWAVAECLLLIVIPWVRLTGYALASWLLARRKVAVGVLGSLALWLAFNRVIAGSFFYFLHAQAIFAMPEGNFLQGLGSSLSHMVADSPLRTPIPWLELGLLPLVYLGVLAAVAVWLVEKGEGLLALTVGSILLLSYNQGVWRSVVRYDLPLTPLLCLPLLVTTKPQGRMVLYFSRVVFAAAIFGQLALQIYFARLFHAGVWAF